MIVIQYNFACRFASLYPCKHTCSNCHARLSELCWYHANASDSCNKKVCVLCYLEKQCRKCKLSQMLSIKIKANKTISHIHNSELWQRFEWLLNHFENEDGVWFLSILLEIIRSMLAFNIQQIVISYVLFCYLFKIISMIHSR